jgi:hypothetical protein
VTRVSVVRRVSEGGLVPVEKMDLLGHKASRENED